MFDTFDTFNMIALQISENEKAFKNGISCIILFNNIIQKHKATYRL